ncbi:hypothetical protein B8A42_05180 [Dolosigranulum pigrum]|uniref:hypothetical protein n=1 Tax=Dolosigranulum pigrum TaxID=29394 RepID=UPI000DBFD97E|nr:hypothetical protein [Dolosigranulum pigrum]QTJ44752.1 hypothetical protein FE328_03905 [Dolosigranulum pigrum]RAN54893.1 hypothetical protein B8A42_05180 [Dolosigranulum pigrum]
MKKSIKIILSTAIIFPILSKNHTIQTYAQNSMETNETAMNNISFEESQNLPLANIYTDTNNNTTFYSVNNPQSIEDYKKLGYTNIQYTKWTGDYNVASTKSKRAATTVAELITGAGLSAIFSNHKTAIQTLTTAFSLSKTLQTQHADVWPVYNVRNIIAIAPNGNKVRIGQEVKVKYYGNKERTNLIKQSHKSFWVG